MFVMIELEQFRQTKEQSPVTHSKRILNLCVNALVRFAKTTIWLLKKREEEEELGEREGGEEG